MNNIQQFLENEELSLREEVFIKELGRTRLEVSKVLEKAQGKIKEDFISDFCIYLTSRETETTEWLKNHDNRLINFILSEVEKEVEKDGYSTREDLLAIIKSLRV